MKKIIILIFSVSLFGCANMQPQSQINSVLPWAEQEYAKAKAGEIKWSAYYTEFYDKLSVLNSFQDKGYYMGVLALGIDAANAYESGRISDEEFKSFQRKAIAQATQHDEDLRRHNQQVAAEAFNQYLQNQSIINQQWQSRQPIYCNSTQFGNTVNTQCN